jgi:2'-5' RNA ligase
VTARIRAFLAVDAAFEVHAALVDLKRELAGVGAAVRWVRDEGLHATVKFLGSVSPETLTALHDSLIETLADLPTFPARVAGLGAFPSLRRPRVVWIGLESPALAELARRVEAAAVLLGLAPEPRPFHPHITLGRVSGTRGLSALVRALEDRWTVDFGICTISCIVAYRSDLQRGGAVYTELWTIPLSGRRKGEDHGT